MNVYTGLLFLHGYLTDPDLLADYGAGYGNRVANARATRERWERGEPLALAAEVEAGTEDKPARAA